MNANRPSFPADGCNFSGHVGRRDQRKFPSVFITNELFVFGEKFVWGIVFRGVDIDSAMHDVPVTGCYDLFKKSSGCFLGCVVLFTDVINSVPGK